MLPLLPLALTGASFLPALFGAGGNDDLDKALGQLEKDTAANKAKAAQVEGEGSALMAPVSKYLGDITKGDRQSIMQATMPERRRVIDQYDTAKRAISEFAPRGGGLAGTMAQVNAQEASDLSTIGAQARKEGMGQAADLGMAIRNLAIPREQLASMNLNQLIDALTHQDDQSHETMMGLGESLGTVIGLSMIR